MKRSNGTGCVRKLKGNRRKPFQAIITKGYIDNKQKFLSIGTYSTRAEAEYELYKYINNLNSNTSISLKDLYKEWSNNHYKNISKNSIKYYTNAYNKMKSLHDKDISRIKLSDLQQYCIQLSKSNQVAFKITISQMLDYAVACDYISKNYSKFLEIKQKSNHAKREIFTQKEIERYTNTDDLYDVILSIMLYTGMRVGELLNLKITDINIEKEVLNIKNAKTKSSIRSIPIHSKIKNKLIFLIKYNNIYLIEKNGYKIEYGTFRREFLKRYNHKSHDTRHTFATRCKICQVDPLATKLILGHTITDITFGTYTHVTDEFLKLEIEKVFY